MAPEYPRIVQRLSGGGTMTGEGDTVVDNRGNRYRIVSSAEASIIRNSTAGIVYSIHPDGTIR